MRRYIELIVAIFLFFPLSLAAAEIDTSEIEIRKPDEQWLNNLVDDKEFIYRQAPQEEGYLQKLFKWLAKRFMIEPGSFADSFIKEYFWYLLFTSVIIFVVYKLLGAKLTGFLSRKPVNKIRSVVLEEDIENIDFEQEIETAVKQGHYRLAVRLFYLRSLKMLNDKGLINWRIDKTNQDYQNELINPISQDFSRITFLYNWIWYGEANILYEEFNSARQEFRRFTEKLLVES